MYYQIKVTGYLTGNKIEKENGGKWSCLLYTSILLLGAVLSFYHKFDKSSDYGFSLIPDK